MIGAGVVGAAVALALARRGVARDGARGRARARPGRERNQLRASSTPGSTPRPASSRPELILRSAELREPVLDALGIPVLRCGRAPTGARRRGAIDHGTAGGRRRAQRRGGGARRRRLAPRAGRVRDRSGALHARACGRRRGPRRRAADRAGRVTALRRVPDGFELEDCRRRSPTRARGRQLRRPARRRGGAHGRRRLVRDLPAQGGVPGVRPARRPCARADPAAGAHAQGRRVCSCFRRSTARWWRDRPPWTSRTRTTGRCAPRRPRRSSRRRCGCTRRSRGPSRSPPMRACGPPAAASTTRSARRRRAPGS